MLTTTIPIAFTTSCDPIQLGLVASHRPDDNVIGFTDMSSEIIPKQFGLLQELLPRGRQQLTLFDIRTALEASWL